MLQYEKLKTTKFIISGPCVIESEDLLFEVAEKMIYLTKKHNLTYIFKASYDKANRTSINSFRGPGLIKGLDLLDNVKSKFNIPITSDVHDANECKIAGEVLDIVQVPAFLCRQTDLVKAACKTGKIVNIKKGQFLAPWDVNNILSKTEGAKEVWITERGTSFGYNTLVVDYTGLDYMLNNIDADIVFDVTHSVQKPGGHGTSSGGNRDYVPGLARSGSALGIRNFFLEVHHDPDNAPSDGPNALHLKDFEKVVDEIHRYSYSG